MKPRHSLLVGFVLVAVASLLQPPAGAQYDRRAGDALPHGWENNWMRLSRITVGPGAALPAADTDRILVYLTATPEGRMPPAEAVWHPAGSADLENRGRLRVEALAIELKDTQPSATGGTPPEALSVSHRVDVEPLIDNERVLVVKHRYAPTTHVHPSHFHPEDILVVYLRGGHMWLPVGGWGPYRVMRGEVQAVPAYTFHRLSNAGADPLEVLVVLPRG